MAADTSVLWGSFVNVCRGCLGLVTMHPRKRGPAGGGGMSKLGARK